MQNILISVSENLLSVKPVAKRNPVQFAVRQAVIPKKEIKLSSLLTTVWNVEPVVWCATSTTTLIGSIHEVDMGFNSNLVETNVRGISEMSYTISVVSV